MTIRLSSLLLLGLAFAGCASASGSGAVFALALWVSVAATACLAPAEGDACGGNTICNYLDGETLPEADGDAGPGDVDVDTGADALCWNEDCGVYEPCDQQTICNYWYDVDAADGDVGWVDVDADVHVDADAPGPDIDVDADAEECWYECAGEIIPCDWSCNYWEVWADTTPDASWDASPDVVGPDATDTSGPDGASDAAVCDGVWEPCCLEGTIAECCCPGGAECNYGLFDTCPDDPQACVMPGEACPP